MELTVLIINPISVEYDATCRQLDAPPTSEIDGSALYTKGRFQGKHHAYTIIIREPGSKNANIALATEKAIQKYKPDLALLVGIAAGIKDAAIGDLVVARKAYGLESGKEQEDGFKSRPESTPFSGELLACAQDLSRGDAWKKRTSDGAAAAKVFLGAIASSDKVVAGTNNPTYQRLKQHFNDTLALEMESSGFAQALQDHRTVHGLNIRGISDLCEGKAEADAAGNQERAAERAAAFAFELLWGLDASSFVMNTKILVREIYNLLLPTSESIKDVEADFEFAENNNIKAIWQSVKPLLRNEIDELKKSPNDPDIQADVRNGLRRALESKIDLQKELVELLNVEKRKIDGVAISVTGSSIKAGGNISIGRQMAHYNSTEQVGRDKVEIHNYYGDIKPNQVQNTQRNTLLPLPPDFKAVLQEMISKGRPEQALDELALFAKDHPGSLQHEILALSDRWQDMAYKIRMGLISHENAVLNRNQIVSTLIGLIS